MEENYQELNVEVVAENLEYLLDLVDSVVLDGLEFVAVDFVIAVDDDDWTDSLVVVEDDVDSDSVFAAVNASVDLGSNVVDSSSAYFDASIDLVVDFQAFVVPENLVASSWHFLDVHFVDAMESIDVAVTDQKSEIHASYAYVDLKRK